MSLTITFPNELAQRLETEARQRQVSVEELAATILDQAVPPAHSWKEHNQRRLMLIRKSNREALSREEHEELDALQSMLDARFDDFDAALKSQLASCKTALSGNGISAFLR